MVVIQAIISNITYYYQTALEKDYTIVCWERNFVKQLKLLLSPVAVKTEYQRQHISKEIIEFGFQRAVEMGFKAVIVEGNPQNYRARGFQTSHDLGIVAGRTLSLPSPVFAVFRFTFLCRKFYRNLILAVMKNLRQIGRQKLRLIRIISGGP